MSLSTFQEIVQFAIDKEKNAQAFYRSAAGLAQYPGIPVLFNELAAEEQKHEELLRNLEDVAHLPEPTGKVPDLKISDYLLEMKFYPEIKYQEVMMLAMKNEEKSFKFYAAWAENSPNPEQKKLFGHLAEEEAKHKYRLESIYDQDLLD
ncbi:MAG: ferritin family protein [Desulfobacterota bacterium]|jgi:rubrerythrin|nr:ferritin family protein [Thermodesulfobacteriota bacterium]